MTVREWQVVMEYVDEASAANMRDRKAWRELMEHVRKGGIDLVLVTNKCQEKNTRLPALKAVV